MNPAGSFEEAYKRWHMIGLARGRFRFKHEFRRALVRALERDRLPRFTSAEALRVRGWLRKT